MSSHLSAPPEQPVSSVTPLFPLHTVRCDGPAVFRNQLARDIGCLLDVDDDVISWTCGTVELVMDGVTHVPDLVAESQSGIVLIDAVTKARPSAMIAEMAAAAGYQYRPLSRLELPAIRLRNAKDLLRYARYSVTLDDRIRVLAALDECGTMTLAECLSGFRTTQPLPAFASMVLQRFIAIDLDDALIGPESTVRRFRG